MERGKTTSLLDCSGIGTHCAPCVRGICDLPDLILSHILSFLPSTKDAVATSILSQRWKFLWTMTDNLRFDVYYGSKKVDRFVEFVNHVLHLHNPGFLNEFSLTWPTRCIPFYVNSCISTAIARNVRKLSLDVKISEFPIHVQRSMFSCESLESLTLILALSQSPYHSLKNDAFCISQEIDFSLPKLESLDLESVIFESEETLCKLLGGCPVLKSLCLAIHMNETKKRCHLGDGISFRCIISSTSLRRLVLFADDEDGRRRSGDMSICEVQLDAPSLNYIVLDMISNISIQQTHIYLAEASIRLAIPEIQEEDHYDCVVEAFHAFDCAKKLVLNSEVIRAFKSATVEMKTIFNQLTRLEVEKEWLFWIDFHHFLQWVGNLQVFVLHQNGWHYHCWGDESEREENTRRVAAIPDPVPMCLSNSLRFVLIDGYGGNDDEGEDDFRTISYILKHSSVLQLMEIQGLDREPEVIQKIRELPRKSPVCEVEFPKYRRNRISFDSPFSNKY